MANIPVDEWDVLTADKKKEISEALRAAGALQPGDSFVDSGKKSTADRPIAEGWDPICDICKAACDAAAVTAAAWCTANTAGAGLVVCLAAAESARKECRRRCC